MAVWRGHNHSGIFVTFSSGEGGGKGTQIKMFVNYLEKHHKLSPVVGREPGSTPEGEAIRRLVQSPDSPDFHPDTELYLFSAQRDVYFRENVRPALQQGKIFVSDRTFDDTEAYQVFGGGADRGKFVSLTKIATGGIVPDISFLIDVDPEEGLSRATVGEFGERKDRFEAKELSFHRRVREGYKEIARRNSERFRIIPYIAGNPNMMQQKIREEFDSYLSELKIQK